MMISDVLVRLYNKQGKWVGIIISMNTGVIRMGSGSENRGNFTVLGKIYFVMISCAQGSL